MPEREWILRVLMLRNRVDRKRIHPHAYRANQMAAERHATCAARS